MPNYKSQINSKFQIQMTRTILFGLLNFGYWNLFGIWYLPAGRQGIWGAYFKNGGLFSPIHGSPYEGNVRSSTS